MAGEGAWTRGELVRDAARLGAAVIVGGGLRRLVAGDVSLARGATIPPGAVKHFVSRPDLRPPALTVIRSDSWLSGYLFLAPSSGPGQRGVLILDARGDVVFFHPTTPNTAMNFRTARFHGRPVLTWWEGKAESGLGRGTHVILDHAYTRTVHTHPTPGRGGGAAHGE